MRATLGLLLVAAVIAGCKEQKSTVGVYKEQAVVKTSKNFEIPKSLKDRIEKNYIKFIRNLDPSNIDSDEKIIEKIPRDFLEVDVYFTQQNEGTLDQNFVMRSPRGGGLIDLAGRIQGSKGSFFVRFDVKVPGSESDSDTMKDLQTYYLAGAPKRKIDTEWFGSDCGTLVDISSAVEASRKDLGLRVNATADRYYNTLIGDYFFVSYAPDKIYLAAVMIDDSSVSLPRCPVRVPE